MRIKTAWFILIGALVVALPVRIYQMLFLVDPATGFFTDQNIVAICLAIFMIIVSAVIMFMCFYDKNAPKRFEPIKNIPAMIAAAASGIGIIVHSISALLIDNGAHSSLSQDAANAVNALEGGQAYLNVIMAFVGVAAGIVILIAAFNFATGKNVFRSIPVVAIIPPLWFCINLITLFTNYTNVTYMTENMMDMFSMILVTFFLLSQGKMFARVNPVKSGKRIYAFGLPTILYGFVSALPSFVLQAMDLPHTSSFKMTLNIAIFLVAVYALVFLLIYPKIPNYREEMEEEEEEDEQPAEDVQPLAQELPVQEEVKEEMPVVQQEKRPTLNDMELEADEEEDEPLVFEDDGREIPYLINREPVFRLEKKERKKKRKKKKRRSIFYFIPFVKKRVDKKEAEAKRPAWTPAPREESTKKLENDWILDFYGYERRPKDNTNIQSDEPYIPKVVDVEQENTTETDTHKDEIDK